MPPSGKILTRAASALPSLSSRSPVTAIVPLKHRVQALLINCFAAVYLILPNPSEVLYGSGSHRKQWHTQEGTPGECLVQAGGALFINLGRVKGNHCRVVRPAPPTPWLARALRPGEGKVFGTQESCSQVARAVAQGSEEHSRCCPPDGREQTGG